MLNNDDTYNAPQVTVSNHTIFVALNNGKIVLTGDIDPSGTTVVKQGDTVTWQITTPSLIPSIAIVDSSALDIFNPDPRNIGSNAWQGTVAAAPGNSETYSVKVSTGESYDPKISINA